MQYVVDSKGKLLSVILSMAEYKRLIKAAEELESIRACDAAKESQEEAISIKGDYAE